MGLRSYIATRLLQFLPMVFVVICINFIIINAAPGDPVIALIGEGAIVPPEYIELTRVKWGLNKPIYERLYLYIANVFRGDLGNSYLSGGPVLDIILNRVGNTLLLTLTAQLIAIPLGILMGAYLAKHYLSKRDVVATIGGWMIYSMPIFWVALMLMYVFGVWLRWLPTSGMQSIGASDGGSPLDVLRHMILPVIPMVLWNSMLYMRICRSSVIEVLEEDYITTARAKGISENRVFIRHALRNALLPTVTVIGIQLGYIFIGGLVLETVFAWPGLGSLTLTSIGRRDYPLLMGIFLVTSLMVLAMSLFIDILYAYIDPRIRRE